VTGEQSDRSEIDWNCLLFVNEMVREYPDFGSSKDHHLVT
jgi:hypothetical protein